MKSFSRREFVALSAGALAWYSASNPLHAEGSVITRKIPSSSETLPVVGLGTYQAFDVTSATDRQQAAEILKLFAESGGRLVDSSPMYGAAEEVAGEAAAQLGANNLFIATKVWTSGEQAGIEQMQASMRKLRRKIDLMQVHNLLDAETHLKTLAKWKTQGLIRYTGVTHYHSGAYGELERWIRSRRVDFVQLNFSIAEREAEDRLLPAAADHGVAVIANRPFAEGELFRRVKGKPLPEWAADMDCATWAQLFLKYIVGHPAVSCAIPATRNPEHLRDNMGAARGRLPSPAERKKMVAAFEAA